MKGKGACRSYTTITGRVKAHGPWSRWHQGSRFHLSENETPSSLRFHSVSADQRNLQFSVWGADRCCQAFRVCSHIKRKGGMDSSQAFKTVIHLEGTQRFGRLLSSQHRYNTACIVFYKLSDVPGFDNAVYLTSDENSELLCGFNSLDLRNMGLWPFHAL